MPSFTYPTPPPSAPVRRTGFWRWVGRPLLVFLLIFLLPVGLSGADYWLDEERRVLRWHNAPRGPTGLAPDPATTPEAVVQVYAARAFSWRGIFGVHTWISVKPAQAAAYTRLEVMGWGVRRGGDAVRIRRGDPDGLWFGNRPEVLVHLQGPEAEAAIAGILQAARSYPHNHEYRIWPGPNSNTFTAHIGRQVPALELDLPPNAIGKDFIAGGGVVAPSPSGRGWQLSLGGLAGLIVGLEEGLEVNLLGLNFGLDLNPPALKLPGLGRLGLSQEADHPVTVGGN